MGIGKRVFSILLCLIMVFFLFSMTSIFAVEADTIQISVKNEWNDADNQDGIRPDSITVKLLANGQKTEKTLTLNSENNWTGSFENLPVSNAGAAVNYSLEEADITGYSAEITENAEHEFIVRNTHTPAKISIHVEKIWNDNENVAGKRPQNVKVFLIENQESVVNTLVLPAENSWAGDFTDIPEYKNGKKIEYSIQEAAAGEYHSEISGSAKDGFVVTNTYTPDKIEIPVTLLWKDAGNQDGKRPASVSVKLYRDNNDSGAVLELNAENHWSAKFEELPKYSDGKEVSYRLAELTEITGYTAQTSGSAEEGYVITNSHTPSTVNISVRTVWNDAENQGKKRPESINVLLLANNEKTGATLKLDQSNGWSGKFENLPEYSAGQKISYKVGELTSELKGYTGQITGTAADGFVITNSAAVSISVEKVWNDLENKNGKRPNAVTITLLADNTSTGKTLKLEKSNSWKGKFENLPEYKDGKQIKYTISEVSVENYESKITGNSATGFVVTNTAKVLVSVKNVWNDNNNSAKARPSKIKIILVADGKDTTQTLELSAANNWSGYFNNLDAFSNGKVIKYSIREEEVKGYSYAVTGSAEKGYTITNTYKTSGNNTNGNKTTPNTGDHRNLMVWYILLIISFSGIFTVTVVGIARKKHR